MKLETLSFQKHNKVGHPRRSVKACSAGRCIPRSSASDRLDRNIDGGYTPIKKPQIMVIAYSRIYTVVQKLSGKPRRVCVQSTCSPHGPTLHLQLSSPHQCQHRSRERLHRGSTDSTTGITAKNLQFLLHGTCRLHP